MTFKAHVNKVSAEVIKVANQLVRIMPRVGGAFEAKRRLLSSVATLIVLYAAPSWANEALRYKTNVKTLRRTQMHFTIRITRAYRTISTEGALALARLFPWDLRLKEIVEIEEDQQLSAKDAHRNFIEKWHGNGLNL